MRVGPTARRLTTRVGPVGDTAPAVLPDPPLMTVRVTTRGAAATTVSDDYGDALGVQGADRVDIRPCRGSAVVSV